MSGWLAAAGRSALAALVCSKAAAKGCPRGRPLDATQTSCPLFPSSAAAYVAHGDRAGQRHQGQGHTSGCRPGPEELPDRKGARHAGRRACAAATLRADRRFYGSGTPAQRRRRAFCGGFCRAASVALGWRASARIPA
eukprot:scaffold3_cov108-Isochrysis_galbana.AAC.5